MIHRLLIKKITQANAKHKRERCRRTGRQAPTASATCVYSDLPVFSWHSTYVARC